ncbi:MAG: hypothetical protein NC402_06095 [Prevotella sp.]|nr:hypothetical protein [Prevotella sp.]MCM1075288.1 hypothetical protein [Ruminococcus sp.]
MARTFCYIFNPDNEMALATSGCSYTPPRKISDYIRQLSLLPSIYALPDSQILVPSDISDISLLPYYDVLKAKGMKIVSECTDKDAVPIPWGWSACLKTRLLKAGFSEANMPTDKNIQDIRELSHRSLTGKVYEYFKFDEVLYSRRPVCVHTLEEATENSNGFKRLGKEFVAKLPRSSSGRGVIFNPTEYTMGQMLSRQGSLMIEPRWNKTIDFATEWNITGGKARFVGFSLFNCDNHAQYSGNVVASQQYIKEYILQHCNTDELQQAMLILKSALENLVADKYTGPLGVDMLCDISGKINPCVEVNVRMTMGHVALKLHEQYCKQNKSFIFYPGKDLPAYE